MKILKVTLMLLILGSASIRAQKPNIIPPSPNAASFSKYGDIPINLSTGAVNLSVPIYTSSEGALAWPIAMNYNYTGYRPAEESSWIGRGWSLPVGVITRTVHGTRDEGNSGIEGYFTTGSEVKTAVQNKENGLPVDYTFINYIADGLKDGEPDIFNFSFGAYSGKFFFGTDGKIYNTTGKALEIKYEMSLPLDPGSGHHFVGNTFTKWTIRTEDGTKYIFKNAEYGWTLLEGAPFDKFAKTISAWHLSEIIGVHGERIKFFYTAPTDTFKRIQGSYSQRRVLPLPNIGNPPNYFISEVNNSVVKNYSEEIALTKIQGSNWELQFNSSQLSKTVNGETSYYQRLNQIVLNDITNPATPVQIKTFDFTYDAADNEKLVQFQEKNGAEQIKPYVFEYNQAVNVGLTYSVDNWGYYNGVDNAGNLISEFGADRQAYLAGTLMGSLNSVKYPTGGYSTFEYELNQLSYIQSYQYITHKTSYDYYSFVWKKVGNGLTLIQSQPFTLPETRTYESTYNFDYIPQNPPCKPLTETGSLAAGSYTASNFTPPQCIISDMPDGAGIDIQIKIKKIELLVKGDVGGLRIKKVSNYTAAGLLAYEKQYLYENFSDPTRSSGAMADSIDTHAEITKFFSDGSACRAGVWKSEPLNTVSLTPLLYFNIEEKLQDSKQYHEFTSYNAYNDSYGLMMAGGGSCMFGPIASYEFIRGLPAVSTHYRTNLTNKAYESFKVYSTMAEVVVNSSPAIYCEHIANYNSPGGIYGNSDNKEYYVKGYKAIAGWVRLKSEMTKDYGAGASSSPVIESTTYEYSNLDHRQVTKQRTTQSDGTVEETNFLYPLDFKNTSGKAAFIQPMIDSNMVAYPLEQAVTLEKSANDRKVIAAEVTTYKAFPGNSQKQTLIMSYKKFSFNGMNGSLGQNFQNYQGKTDETASNSYREILKYTHYDNQGNPLSLLLKGAEKVSYLWSHKGEKVVAEINNADNAAVSAALGGTNFAQMAAMTDPSAIKNKLDAVRAALPAAMMTSYVYSPVIGITRTIDPAGKNLLYEYDPLSRLKAIKDNGGNTRSSYCYNYAGQIISCDVISATGTIIPQALSLIPEENALPVILINFNAIKEENSAHLTWTTSEEANSKQFDIERSPDAKTWTRIGSVLAVGESNTTTYYSFRDGAPHQGLNYYRLKMIDTDGSYAYSRIEDLKFDTQIVLFPNPLVTGQLLNLRTASDGPVANLKIYDIRGKLVYELLSPNNQVNLDHLAAGSYIIQLTGANGAVSAHKIIKQ
ncbi:T9SS type A sorting domain-containing protein [Dyadobacter sp. BHUBP1]|uniref:T9SS type A sorting domain-containing protein n=1 Tax=Dyadobacter sp. BHUBP1 TaxID=3424178 RepID=UPI003D33E6FD